MPSLTTLPLPQSQLPNDSQPKGPAWPRQRVLLLGGLLAVVLLLLLAWALTSEQRAIDNMEPQARAALFQETWQGFQTLCQPQVASALVSRCQQQAQFLLKFPECDGACRQQLDPFLHPTR